MNIRPAKILLVSILLLATITAHAGIYTAHADTDTTTAPAPFTDVTVGNSHYVAIQSLKDSGVIEGYEDGSFKPKQEITRTEALKIIALSTGKITIAELDSAVPDIPEKQAIFTDIDSDAWYVDYLYLAKAKEIINGYPDGGFHPDNAINLVETLKMNMECLDITNHPAPDFMDFTDVDKSGWYAKYVAYATAVEILDISAKNEIFPDKKMTRGNFAEVIYRLRQSYDDGYKFGKATFYGKAVQGNYTASGEIFDMYAFTAAHKTLPFGTIVEVTNLSNGKKVEVKINDRGPFGAGRVIDLSEAAFEELAPLGTGIINVQYIPVNAI